MVKKVLILLIVFIINMSVLFANEAERINVAFTIDNNYPVFTLLTINSILKNNISKSNYTFYIVENNLTDKNKKMMENFVKKRNQKIEFININEALLKQNIYKYTECHHITAIGMARIYLPNVLPQNVDKVLYLDADTLVISDLKELYDEDLTGYIAAMVLDVDVIVIEKKIYAYKKDYFNSGVILIDLKKAREENSTKQFEDFLTSTIIPELKKENSAEKKYKYPDQDLINYVWKNKIKKVHYKWNMQSIKTNDEGIIHYITSMKPWHFLPYIYSLHMSSRTMYVRYWDECWDLRFYRPYYVIQSIFKDYMMFTLQKLKELY